MAARLASQRISKFEKASLRGGRAGHLLACRHKIAKTGGVSAHPEAGRARRPGNIARKPPGRTPSWFIGLARWTRNQKGCQERARGGRGRKAVPLFTPEAAETVIGLLSPRWALLYAGRRPLEIFLRSGWLTGYARPVANERPELMTSLSSLRFRLVGTVFLAVAPASVLLYFGKVS